VNAGASFAGQTIGAARRALTARFKSADIDSAELDARTLVGTALGLDLTGLIASAARDLTATEADRLEEFAMRRLAGEPVARIIGQKEFWGLPFKLSTDTLVPRPDTETVVELALELLGAARANEPLRILDIATGSGAILLALLSELPKAFGVGTDLSPGALKSAVGNATALGFAQRAAFVRCDYAAALVGPFDLIVSNPPYIRTSDLEGLAREVRNHDPHLALDGGTDGLVAYRTLIPQAARLLGCGGLLVVEAGQGQSGPIQALMRVGVLTLPTPPKTDLAGIPRAVAGRKMPR
jgi:release factor glutamine methyltransferase